MKKEIDEYQGDLGKEVFDLDILSSSKYKTFSKPRKNSKKYASQGAFESQCNNERKKHRFIKYRKFIL